MQFLKDKVVELWVLKNSLDKFYRGIFPKNFDCVNDRYCVNGRIRYAWPVTGDLKYQVSYANVVRGVMIKQSLSCIFKIFWLLT